MAGFAVSYELAISEPVLYPEPNISFLSRAVANCYAVFKAPLS